MVQPHHEFADEGFGLPNKVLQFKELFYAPVWLPNSKDCTCHYCKYNPWLAIQES